MQEVSFSIDFPALGAAFLLSLFLLLISRWSDSFHSPHLRFSDVSSLKLCKPGFRQNYHKAPSYFAIAALVFFALAFVDPHIWVPKEKEENQPPPLKQAATPTEGIAIYFVLDQSGSMAGIISAYDAGGKRTSMTKMDLLKQVTEQFIKGDPKEKMEGRESDMIGIVAFARGAQVLVPLTLDHAAVLKELEKLNYTAAEDQDGTAIGYAIYKTANLIVATRHFAEDLAGEERPAYDIKSQVMILVTDGFQSPNPLDKDKRLRNIEMVEAADYARRNRIKLYIINVEPKMALDEFELQRKLMKQVAELTGGKFYLVDSSMNLSQIYREIDKLEKSVLPAPVGFLETRKKDRPDLYRRISLYPFLIAMGMVFLALSVILETRFLRRVP